ncbi:MAG: hypothetical protein H6807_10175 [Planctomycetes bacterium]|nr:hypothetical protein [Planctomycetota bacterium]
MQAIASRLVFVVAMVAVPIWSQTTLSVPSATHPTIQSAINAASDGDTILIAAGVYFESLAIVDKGITLQGAASGPGSGATTIDGSGVDRCLVFRRTTPPTTVHAGCTLRDLNLAHGAPPATDPLGHPESGGGVFLDQGAGSVSFYRCEIHDCLATQGAAIFDLPTSGATAEVRLENCRVFDNRWLPLASSSLPRQGGALWLSGRGVLVGCSLERNGSSIALGETPSGSGGAVYIEEANGVPVTLVSSDCRYLANSADDGAAVYGVSPTPHSPYALQGLAFRHCVFDGNVALNGAGAIAADAALSIITSLLTGNDSTAGAKVIDARRSNVWISSSTIAGNATGNLTAEALRIRFPAPVPLVPAPTCDIYSTILAGNGQDAWTIEGVGSNPQPSINYSLLGRFPDWIDPQAGSAPVPVDATNYRAVIAGLDPGFQDVPAGDFHLRASSPAVDIAFGTPNYAPLSASTDFDLLPRPVGDGPDAGCYERQAPDPGPAFAGTIPDGSGGLADSLLFNGSAGGVARKVWTPVGASYTIDVLPAPADASAHFVVFGKLGAPEPANLFPIPFAQGTMAFPPQVAAPLDPTLFTAFDSTFGFVPLLSVPIPPAPFSYTGLALPFPTVVTLQGLITVGPTSVRLTNAVVIHGY